MRTPRRKAERLHLHAVPQHQESRFTTDGVAYGEIKALA
jgi:hypothetical protein